MAFRFWSPPSGRAHPVARPVKWGGVLLQLALACLVLGGVWFVVATTLDNLASRGITTGFAFLNRSAGFDVTFSLLPFGARSPIWMAFLVGVTNTLFLSIIGILLGTIIALPVISFRISRSPLARALASGFIGIFRNTPFLLHLFFWYFAVFSLLPSSRASLTVSDAVYLNNRGLFLPAPEVPALVWIAALCVGITIVLGAVVVRRAKPAAALAQPLTSTVIAIFLALAIVALGATKWNVPVQAGLGMRGGIIVVPELMSVLVAVSLYSSAFIAELMRGAIFSVPDGQSEAGRALGLKRSTLLRLIILPQAIRIAIPPLTNQYVNLIKQTAIVSAIAFPDLMHIFGKTVLTLTGQAIEVLSIVTAVYLVINLACSALMHFYSSSMRARGGLR